MRPGGFFRALVALLVLTSAAARAAETEPQCGSVTGNTALAIQVCTRMIEFGSLERPDLAKAYYTRGTEFGNAGNAERAIADLDMAIKLDPKLVPAYYNRALVLSNRDEHDRAIADYDEAIRLSPRDANSYIGRAAEWTAKGEYRRAIADYDAAAKIDSRSAAPYFGRGRARFYAGDFQLAASDFYRAHQIGPGMYSALWLYLARKRADIAGERTLAQEAGTSGSGVWPAPVVALYLGSATPDAVIKAAAHPDASRQRELRCEAAFYVGEWQVLRNAREPALQLLREAEGACPRTFIEREGAVAELRRLQQTASR
jgi:lipoprotein NlpI